MTFAKPQLVPLMAKYSSDNLEETILSTALIERSLESRLSLTNNAEPIDPEFSVSSHPNGFEVIFSWHHDQSDIACYSITQSNSNTTWIKEIWTNHSERRKGWAGKLIHQCLFRHPKLWCDVDMNPSSAAVIEKIAREGSYKVAVVNRMTGQGFHYHPDLHQHIPLYDIPAFGRPALSKTDAEKTVWLLMLEHSLPRRGILSPLSETYHFVA